MRGTCRDDRGDPGSRGDVLGVRFAGLAARYILGWRRLGAALLLATPLIDLALLALIVVDLRSGAAPHWTHGLGAVYLGFSVAYGKRLIDWADRRMAAKRRGQRGKRPPPLYGAAKLRHEWRETGVFWLGIGVAVVVLLACVWLAGGPERAGVLLAGAQGLMVMGLASLVIPLSYWIWPRRAPANRHDDGGQVRDRPEG